MGKTAFNILAPSLFGPDVHKGRFPSFENVWKHWVIKEVHLDVAHF